MDNIELSDIMTELVEVCKNDFPEEGKLKSVDVEGIQLMITIIEGKPVLISRICTHKTYDLTKGHYEEGYVTCMLHTSVFDLEDGEALNAPATEPLEIYETVTKDESIYMVLK
ncbi:MAG: Naphthalene 1,2-dioxygenase system ferredoxin subunit [Candidatus Heimdallarchaeota archaeon LC_2]|nr:MAG: Naphthalene 1,2-dioxygenase system ferredoxin subunit [Candidatus Heimdallarchaeota archaeon LC_2]